MDYIYPTQFTRFFEIPTALSAANCRYWRAERDASRTPQPQTIQLLVSLYKKRSMGMLISLGQPINTSLPYQRGILSKKLVNAQKYLINNSTANKMEAKNPILNDQANQKYFRLHTLDKS